MRKIIICFTLLLNVCILKAQVTVGSELIPPKAAVLNIQTLVDDNPSQGGRTSATGGVLLPRVILEEVNSLKPFIVTGGNSDEKAAHKGMNVYHIGGNGIDAGQYVWDGLRWLMLITDIPPTPITQLNMADVPVGGVTLSDALHTLSNVSYNAAAMVPFTSDLSIASDGNYAFVFRLWGAIRYASTPYLERKVRVYATLYRNGDVIDGIETNVYMVAGEMTTLDKSYTLAGSFQTGDSVGIKLSYNAADWNDSMGTISILTNGLSPMVARSSVIYWKL